MQDTSKMKLRIIRFYVITLLVMGLGSGFALYQNWQQHLQATKITLARDASVTTTFIDNALISAAKSLVAAKTELTGAVHADKTDEATVYQILTHSVNEFVRFTPADVYGLLFFVGKSGHLFSRSGEFPTQDIDFTDRFYFQDLRDHPDKKQTIGPLIKARTTGKYVFHVAVPILDKTGEFYGVLVQQIQTDDLDVLMAQSLDDMPDQIVMHHPSQGISFVFPATQNHVTPINSAAIYQAIRNSELKHSTLIISPTESPSQLSLLVGFAESNTFDYLISASLPLNNVIYSFLLKNRHLLLYVFFGGLFISYLFFRLYRQYIQLENHQFISRHDALTKLHNRWALNEELPVFLLEAMRNQTPISFLFLDIDHFKNINDTLGHDTGDLALAAVAKAIESCLRRPRDFMCRWGGEEFLVIMPDTSEDSAVMLAEAMMAAVKKVQLKNSNLKISISIGIKTTLVSLENINEDLINDAEKAMMMAKKNGRDRYVIFSHNQSA